MIESDALLELFRKHFMKKIVIVFCLLIPLWVFLKYYGLVGRQFSDGQNSLQTFPLSGVGDSFELELTPNKLGLYRYNAGLKFDGKDFMSSLVFKDGKYEKNIERQDILVGFTEVYCETGKVIDTAELTILTQPNQSTPSGLGRSGKVIKPSPVKRSERVCLKVTVKSLSTPVHEALELSVVVMNTRPCWGLECLLD